MEPTTVDTIHQRLSAQLGEIGVPGLTDEAVRELAELALERMQHAIGSRLVEYLSDEDLFLFDQLEQNGDIDGVVTFLDERVPQHRLISSEEIARVFDQIFAGASATFGGQR